MDIKSRVLSSSRLVRILYIACMVFLGKILILFIGGVM